MRYTISRKLMASSRRRGHESTYLGINSCTLELWYLFYFMHNFALLEVLSIFSERMISFEVLSIRVKRNIFVTRLYPKELKSVPAHWAWPLTSCTPSAR